MEVIIQNEIVIKIIPIPAFRNLDDQTAICEHDSRKQAITQGAKIQLVSQVREDVPLRPTLTIQPKALSK